MKLYKFRSLENWVYTKDILENSRLFCAKHRDLNDPFEGFFFRFVSQEGGIIGSVIGSVIGSTIGSVIGGGTTKRYSEIEKLPNYDENTRVCSLSKSLSDIRLWSYYANDHKGLAIELELEEGDTNLHEVIYSGGISDLKEMIKPKTSIAQILQYKTDHWAHEQEYRLITNSEYYSVTGKITGVYFGIRTPQDMKEQVLEVLPSGTAAYETKVNPKEANIGVGRKL